MGVTNLYSNLPGHLVEFKDGGLQLTTKDEDVNGGKSLLILGTAFDGPINEPVKIDNTTVTQLFGSEVNSNGYPNGATLTKYAKQAFKNGFTDVRCMRVTGSPASVDISKAAVVDTVEKSATMNSIAEGATLVVNSGTLPSVAEGPVILSTFTLTTEDGNPANAETGAVFAHMQDFNIANAPKGVNFKYSYSYKKYETFTTTFTAAETDAAIDASTALDLVTSGVFYDVVADTNTSAGGDNDKAFYTALSLDDAVVTDTASSSVLVESADYEIDRAAGKIYFTGARNTDVTITGFKYTVTSVGETAIPANPAEPAQEITIAHPAKAGTVEIVYTIPRTTVQVTVDDADIVLGAGNTTVKIKPTAAIPVGAPIVVSYAYDEDIVTVDKMTVRSIYGGSVYKKASVEILTDAAMNKIFKFTKPDSKKYTATEAPLEFNSANYPTVGALKLGLSNAALNNVFEIVTDNDDIETVTFDVMPQTFLTDGGDDGVVVTADQLFEALSGERDASGYLVKEGAYQVLENYSVDYIYPAGVYADTKLKDKKYEHTSFHRELALLCAVLTYRTKMTHGFIDVKPNSNTTLIGIQNYVNNLLNYNNTFYMQDEYGDDITDSAGNKMDIGWYTSLVVGPEPVMISDTLGTYYGSPAIAYAALNASLKPQSAPTNKALPNVKGMKFKLSNKQLDALVGNRMVVFRLKNEGSATASSTPYVVDGMTCGNPNCDYTRLSTVKVVTDVVDQIREVADPFIGEPNTVEQRNALSALISKRLSYLMEQGEIQYFEFEINATLQQVVLGECSLALTLVCPMELRKITTVVALRAAA